MGGQQARRGVGCFHSVIDLCKPRLVTTLGPVPIPHIGSEVAPRVLDMGHWWAVGGSVILELGKPNLFFFLF